MKKKIILRAPLLTRSGYGEQARFALRSLLSKPEVFDVYVQPLDWGKTSWTNEDTPERKIIDDLIKKTIAYTEQQGPFDMSLQVTIPNEWQKLTPMDIGYTAGIETNRVAPIWLEKAIQMDKIIVVSNHAKAGFTDTIHHGVHRETGQTMELKLGDATEVEVVGYPVKSYKALPTVELDVSTKFNFLCVAQMGPRKDLPNTVKWFMEEFHDEKEVGLILKTNFARNCLIDRNRVYRDLKATVVNNFPDHQCKLYLLHGDMTDEEMHSLYRHKNIDAFYMLSHGEGFGLPYFEAAYSGLPVIAPGWSGHMDFLCDENEQEHFYNVAYDVQPIPEGAVWDGVLLADSMWANAREKSAKRKLRQCYEDFTGESKKEHKKKATKYAKELSKRFAPEAQYAKFAEAVYTPDEDVEEWLSELEQMVNV